MATTELMEAAPAAVGALAGGGGVLWIAKLLINRMIRQYDEKHAAHDKLAENLQDKIERLVEKLAETKTQAAVLEDRLRSIGEVKAELQAVMARIQGELETKHSLTLEEVADLRADIYVAHERIRMIAGDTDFSTIQKPAKVRRR